MYSLRQIVMSGLSRLFQYFVEHESLIVIVSSLLLFLFQKLRHATSKILDTPSALLVTFSANPSLPLSNAKRNAIYRFYYD